jgi:hypothetical protein
MSRLSTMPAAFDAHSNFAHDGPAFPTPRFFSTPWRETDFPSPAPVAAKRYKTQQPKT